MNDAIRKALVATQGNLNAAFKLVLASADGKRERDSSSSGKSDDESDQPPTKVQRSDDIESDDLGVIELEELDPNDFNILRSLSQMPGLAPVLRIIMMNLDPGSLRSLCLTAKAFREICNEPSFRQEYHNKWFIEVSINYTSVVRERHFRAESINLSLLKTRKFESVVSLLPQLLPEKRYRFFLYPFNFLFTSQSSLQGMLKFQQTHNQDNDPVLYIRARAMPYPNLMYSTPVHHFSEDGTVNNYLNGELSSMGLSPAESSW